MDLDVLGCRFDSSESDMFTGDTSKDNHSSSLNYTSMMNMAYVRYFGKKLSSYNPNEYSRPRLLTRRPGE